MHVEQSPQYTHTHVYYIVNDILQYDDYFDNKYCKTIVYSKAIYSAVNIIF